MFDSNTVEVIRAARQLEGLDTEALSKRLTETFASIVGLRAGAASGAVSEEETNWLRRLADTYEACVCLMPEATHERSACAFVAATAHNLLARLRRARVESEPEPESGITGEGIPSEVSASLLFMIAGAFADARESSNFLNEGTVGGGRVEAMIRMLCRGSYADLRRVDLKPLQGISDLDEAIVETCWHSLGAGLQSLASYLLGIDDDGAHNAGELFSAVERATALTADQGNAAEISGRTLIVVGGPHHLAMLPLRLLPLLVRHSLAHISPPAGTEATAWTTFIASLAEHRALLWPNHMRALDKGFLTPGTSSVVTFPTGAGKTTLVHLKVAIALLRGKPAVCLAPTRALVDQTARDLQQSLRSIGEVRRVLDSDDDSSSGLPAVFVCTPEECLAALGQGTDELDDLGLVVFDECHLLHPKQGLADQRSLEAMLCLLSLMHRIPSVDVVLLSAMVSNAAELAEWLQSALGRPCLALDDTWKPTRQARGCVVYPVEEAQALRAEIASRLERAMEERSADPKWKGAPRSRDRDGLVATPLGLFCLQQLWAVEDASDYSIQPLLDRKTSLALGSWTDDFPKRAPSWHLTSNRYQVAADLAANLAASGIQTMILSQSTRSLRSTAERAAKDLTRRGVPAVKLNDEESRLLAAAAQEFGGEEHVVVFVGERSAIHHGLLLPDERAAAESLFSRSDGIRVLVVSPTMSQGMNLPAEAVIIAGDDRFDPDSAQVMPLEAYELLNAAGRAGRAGSCANGLVIVVPGAVVTVARRDGGYQLDRRWFQLQERVFSNSDQCLSVNDPLELWLDKLQADSASSIGADGNALFNRLPSSDEDAQVFVGRSLAAYRLRTQTGALDAQLGNALRLRQELPAWKEEWHREVGVANGVGPSTIEGLAEAVASIQDPLPCAADWADWWFAWLFSNPDLILSFLPDDILTEAVKLPDDPSQEDRGRAIGLLQQAMRLWLNGEPLCNIERVFRPDANSLGTCDSARRFVLRVVPRVAWALGLVESVLAGLRASVTEVTKRLASCVRLGFDRVEKLALFDVARSSGLRLSRVQVHARFHAIRGYLASDTASDAWHAMRVRVRRAHESWLDDQEA